MVLEFIYDIFRHSHEGIHEDNIVKAAEAFNNQFKIKHWVVHYEVSIDTSWSIETFIKLNLNWEKVIFYY